MFLHTKTKDGKSVMTNVKSIPTEKGINNKSFKRKMAEYRQNPASFLIYLTVIICTIATIGMLLYLLIFILAQGIPHLITEVSKLFSGLPSLFDWKYNTDNVSLVPSIFNTLLLTASAVGLSALFGIFTAVYLVEYAKKDNKVVGIIRITAETLSGIPSIVYGLFGMIFFVQFLDMGISLMSGMWTVSIMILPLIMRSTEEALKSVPDSYREASFGLGAGKLRTVFTIVLPAAVPGILAGIILAIGRVIGETAALLYTSGTSSRLATTLDSAGRTLSVHMYMLSGEGLHFNQAYATAVVLLAVVLFINWISGVIAKKLLKA